MEFHIDKRGLLYATKFILSVSAIFLSFHFMLDELQHYIIPDTPNYDIAQNVLSNEDFYIDAPNEKPVFAASRDVLKKRDTLVWEKRDFLFVDLATSSITVYKNGIAQGSFVVVGKPTAGSFFAMPSGFYKVQAKAENPASKLEKVKFPWALYLYNNYIIHGLPSTLTGRAEPPTYRGGGVRLALADAQQLYDTAPLGTSVLIYNPPDSKTSVTFDYTRRTNLPAPVPEVTAASALAADLETGEILFEKNKTDAYPLASVSKLMTSVVALEHLATSSTVTVSQDAVDTYGDSAALRKGEGFTTSQLLYALILPSSNDAAKAFELAVPNFISLMNKKAKDLKLTKATYHDSSGLDQNNVASAADLFTLLQYISAHQPQILAISKTKEYAAISLNKKIHHVWRNINWPTDDKHYIGGKAGWIQESLQTMAGIYAIRFSEYGTRPIAIITLGSHDRVRDVRVIMNYLEQQFIHGATHTL